MKLDGRRESGNVEDRRGMSGGTAAGLGLGGIVIVGLITLMMGGNLGDILRNVSNMGGVSSGAPTTQNRRHLERLFLQVQPRHLPESDPRPLHRLHIYQLRDRPGGHGPILLLRR